MDFSETIAACDLKLIDLMKTCEYLRSRSFLDLCQMSFTYENLNLLFQKPLAHFQPNFECKYKLMKIHQHNAGHMTKMAAMPIWGKNTLLSSQEPITPSNRDRLAQLGRLAQLTQL